jgi:hypothetical protein
MVAETLIAVLAMSAVAICVFALLAVYSPHVLTRGLEARRSVRRALSGPTPQGRPIQDIASDLRTILRQHERLQRTRSEWYSNHGLRVSERNVHDVVEEAATALGLGPCPATVGTWTSAHLSVRLRELSDAGLVLPQGAWEDRR